MKSIKEVNLSNKTVLLRCDYNVSIKDGKIISDERIRASLETINHLIKNNCKIIIMSHLGKVKTEEDKKKNSLYLVYERLCTLLNTKVYFSSATKGQILEDKISHLNEGEVLLVENTRYEDLDGKKESECDEELSRYWASLADIFINDAFAMTHRRHASNCGVANYIESYYGFLIEKEVEKLELINNPQRPLTIIMSGAKVEDKLDIIKGLLPKCDHLLTGGGIANSFLNTEYEMGQSLKNDDKKEELKELLLSYPEKLVLPVDLKVLTSDETVQNKKVSELTPNDNAMDIGEETINIYKDILKESNTIFINGTVGKYEDERFENGTKELLKFVSDLNKIRIIGGGDAISSSEYFNIKDFDFISTGGGATLEYIAEGKLKCNN